MAGGLPDSVEIVRVEVHVEAAEEEDGGGVQLLYDEVQELEGGGRTLSQLHRVPQDVRGSAPHLKTMFFYEVYRSSKHKKNQETRIVYFPQRFEQQIFLSFFLVGGRIRIRTNNNGSEFRKPKNLRILQIRIRNTGTVEVRRVEP
jgi:hypothetical protein